MNINTQIENRYVLALIQALFGAISPNFRAITISEATEDSVSLNFLLEVENPADQEEINDIIFEFEALQEKSIQINTSISTGKNLEDFTALTGRGVYHRREHEKC